jgi:putative redox protein
MGSAKRAKYHAKQRSMTATAPNANDTAENEAVVVEETGRGKFRLQVTSGDASFIVDEPARVGGSGDGPTPYDLLSASLGSCSLLTMRLYADRKGWPLEGIRVAITHSRDGVGARDVFRKEVELRGPLSEEQRTRIHGISARCPVHLTLERGSQIETTLLSARDAIGTKPEQACEHARDMGQACDQYDAPG